MDPENADPSELNHTATSPPPVCNFASCHKTGKWCDNHWNDMFTQTQGIAKIITYLMIYQFLCKKATPFPEQ